jgi:hypothetical protein
LVSYLKKKKKKKKLFVFGAPLRLTEKKDNEKMF